MVWLAEPTENLRRIFYHGYHNDDPAQIFRSSLPAGRVLEDWYDLPPVILCYKLNGDWLDSERGGPVRIVVPEAYGFKSVKWLTHLFLSNIPHANDTYAEGNNDLDSPLKSFAATLSFPAPAAAGEPIPVTGYAQVGISGVSRVQAWITPAHEAWPTDDPHFDRAPWQDAHSCHHGATGRPTSPTLAFSARLADSIPTASHWRGRCAQLGALGDPPPLLPPGDYLLRSRTIDSHGIAQPLPNPFQKSGHAAIETVRVRVE